MQRWHDEPFLLNNVKDFVIRSDVFRSDNSYIFSYKCASHFLEILQLEIISLKNDKHLYKYLIWQSFKSSIVT